MGLLETAIGLCVYIPGNCEVDFLFWVAVAHQTPYYGENEEWILGRLEEFCTTFNYTRNIKYQSVTVYDQF